MTMSVPTNVRQFDHPVRRPAGRIIRVMDACSAFPHSSRSSIASLFVLALTTQKSPFRLPTEVEDHELRVAPIRSFSRPLWLRRRFHRAVKQPVGPTNFDPVSCRPQESISGPTGVHRWEIAEIREELRPAFDHTRFPSLRRSRQEKDSERRAVARNSRRPKA
jgi:hypothetical protein